MNREILFRAKRLDTNKWVAGDLRQNRDLGTVYISGYGYYSSAEGLQRESFEYEVDPKTLGQYVGYEDDKKQKIFEGDIAEMVYDGEVSTYVIVWDNDELDFKGTNGKINYGRNFDYIPCCDSIEVIGNIHDNPEMIKEEIDYETDRCG